MVTVQQFFDATLNKIRNPAIPYRLGGRSEKGTDCINLVGWIMDELKGKPAVARTTNAVWQTKTEYKDTIREAQRKNLLLPCSILFIVNDIGRTEHAGIFVGEVRELMTPDGKPANVVHASESRGGVYPSTLQNGWTHTYWLPGVDYHGYMRGDVTPPQTGGSAEPDESTPGEYKPPQDALQPHQAIVQTREGKGLNLRTEPRTKAQAIKTMPDGTIVDVLEIQGDWARVRWDVKAGLWHTGWCCIQMDGNIFLRFGGENGAEG